MNNIEVVIQSPAITDLERISQIYSEYYVDEEGKIDPEEIKYFTELIEKSIKETSSDATESYLVARKQNEIQGIAGYRNVIKKFLPYTVTPNPLEVYVLFVEKNHSRQGIGKELIEYIKTIAIKKGYTELVVRSASKFRDSGWKFYEKLGFQEVGTIPEKTGQESKIFKLAL